MPRACVSVSWMLTQEAGLPCCVGAQVTVQMGHRTQSSTSSPSCVRMLRYYHVLLATSVWVSPAKLSGMVLDQKCHLSLCLDPADSWHGSHEHSKMTAFCQEVLGTCPWVPHWELDYIFLPVSVHSPICVLSDCLWSSYHPIELSLWANSLWWLRFLLRGWWSLPLGQSARSLGWVDFSRDCGQGNFS